MSISDKLAFTAIGISIFTALFAWYSFSKTDELSKNAFNRNYRPYMIANNFSFINQADGKMYPDISILIIRVLNAPAFVTSKKLTFYARENGSDSVIFEHPDYKNELIYPLDNSQYTIGTAPEHINHKIAQDLLHKKLIRKVRIEYQWVSDSSLKYFFESEWVYSIQKQDWDIIYQDAN